MSKKIIIVFPGQGSQIVGMGSDFYNNYAVAREVFEEVDETLKMNLSKIILEGPEDDLTFTPNTQPALMTVSIAIVRVIESEIKKKIYELAEVIMGHSLGEYSALCSLNAINFSDTANLLKVRGNSMQKSIENIQTKMVAVIGLDIELIEQILQNVKLPKDEVCEIANDNCPGQVILSGTKVGIEKISDILKNKGARSIINLKVSAPFHCCLMKNASEKMEEALKPIKFMKLESKFISNVTSDFEDNTEKIKKLLVKQVYSRVRWRESIVKATKLKNSIVEIGSGKVLTGLNKRINKENFSINISTIEEMDKFFLNLKKVL